MLCHQFCQLCICIVKYPKIRFEILNPAENITNQEVDYSGQKKNKFQQVPKTEHLQAVQPLWCPLLYSRVLSFHPSGQLRTSVCGHCRSRVRTATRNIPLHRSPRLIRRILLKSAHKKLTSRARKCFVFFSDFN